MYSEKQVFFTKHALQRARERRLWKYVSKAKFFFDAIPVALNKVRLDECIYVWEYKDQKAYIITMYQI